MNPTQCNIPNDRPRYYTVAVLLESSPNFKPCNYRIGTNLMDWFKGVKEAKEQSVDELPKVNLSMSPLGVHESDNETDLSTIGNYLDTAIDVNSLYVPEKILSSSSSWSFDIVTSDDKRSACFTSSYGRFVRGTGSVLYLRKKNGEHDKEADDFIEKIRIVKPEDRKFDESWNGIALKENLRYFSGLELARLFGFPVSTHDGDSQRKSFSFPVDCNMKQQWKLIGNSINVKVASKLCELGLSLHSETK